MMIDDNEYNEFVNSVAEFVSNSLILWQQQKDFNVSIQKSVEDLMSAVKIYNDLVSMYRNKVVGQQALLVEHEKRIMDLEKCLKEDYFYKGSYLPTDN